MISFINLFITYALLVIASVAVIVVALFCGKKIREAKDKKEELQSVEGKTEE